MKYRLLDLFCGAGGATKGYQQAGFYVVGVDNRPQPHYCGDEFYQADALSFPLDGYDAYHASPPCQKWMDTNKNGEKLTRHIDLITPIRPMLSATARPFIIENVHKAPLRAGLLLCGTMFGLHVIRHRYFEFNFPPPFSPFHCNHWGQVASGDFIGVYARGGRGHRQGEGKRDGPPESPKVTTEEAMGIDWMSKYELTQAIPPAYTEYIGRYLMQVLAEGDERENIEEG